MKKISIVTGCYNEEENLSELYRQLMDMLNELKDKYTYEIIIADNNSTDHSPQILRELAAKNKNVKVGGIIASFKKIITKTGRPMLFMNLEDLNDKIEIVVSPSVIEKNPAVFQENKIVFISGRTDSRDGTIKVICENIEEILEA